MIKIKINNRTFEVEPGRTILSIAEDGGIKIPTLCHYPGIEEDASCLICSVRNKRDGTFTPACATIVEDGMEIDTKSKEVIEYRKRIIRVILMEHRAECEAPCRVSCPFGYDIPLLNRYLSEGKIKEALSLLVSETGDKPLHCQECEAFCETNCRRGSIDSPISIRNIRMFLSSRLEETSIKPDDQSRPDNEYKKLFSSKITALTAAELSEWLKECEDTTERYREIGDYLTAGYEAKNCMHCDCRAANDCGLREIAAQLGVTDPPEKFDSLPIEKKINRNANLVFERAKCIKCGLCVRACNDLDGRVALTYLNRGLDLIVSEPIGVDFRYIHSEKAEEIYSNICPTGALRKIK